MAKGHTVNQQAEAVRSGHDGGSRLFERTATPTVAGGTNMATEEERETAEVMIEVAAELAAVHRERAAAARAA